MQLRTWVYKYRYTFQIPLSVLLGVYPDVELLGDMVILLLIFEELPCCFSTVAAPVHISINRAEVFEFIPVLTNTCFVVV